MSRFTSTSEFDINRRVQITNETPVYNLFEALNSTMQNDFYEWFIGNQEIRYDVPYSIKQENPNGKYEDNSVAGTVGRFDIIRDNQESDGPTKFDRLEKNQVYYKYVNGGVSPIYGPKPKSELDGPNTHYHSMKLTGVLIPEFDLLLHHSYRYLECLYPDHPDWTYLLTPTEFNDQIRAAGKIIDYIPKNLFFDKVAKSLSKSFTNDELIDEASMIKIHNLKDEAYRRKFYGTYAGYKMIGNDIFQHISVFPVATYLPIKPVTESYDNKTLEELSRDFGENFKTRAEWEYYEKTQLRKIDTFSSIYSNKFKLIDYQPKMYGNFAGYKTFRYFTTLWSNDIYEFIEDYSDITLQSSNISQTAVIKDAANITYQITNNGVHGIYYYEDKGPNVSPISITKENESIDLSYYVSVDEILPKSEIEFEVFNLFDSYVTEENGIKKINLPETDTTYYPLLMQMIAPNEIEQPVWNNIFKTFPKEIKKTYKNPLVRDSLYLDPESTLKCYRNDKFYNNVITKEAQDIYKIYKTKNKDRVDAALLYSFTPGFFKCRFNEGLETSDQSLFGTGVFSISIMNKNDEEFIFTAKGSIDIEILNSSSLYTFGGNFRILTVPQLVDETSKLATAYYTPIVEPIQNYERFFDSETGEILIDKKCKIVKICRIDGIGANDCEIDAPQIQFKPIPFLFDSFRFEDLNFGWGNFLPLIEDSFFRFDEAHIRLEDVLCGETDVYHVSPLTSNVFYNMGYFVDNLYGNTTLYAKSELNESIKNYIKKNLDSFNLYPSDSQEEIEIEGRVDLTIEGGDNLITFESAASKERINTLSIGDIVTGNCVDSDDEIVFITEIGSDYIRVSNKLLTSGTFVFKFNIKVNSVKVTEDKPMDFIDRLKGVNEYEFYNPFYHGIYSPYNSTKRASKAYVNGISNINSWRPYIEGGRYNDVFYATHNFEEIEGQRLIPSTIKFANDLFVEYNADKILYYPTRSGKEECLMSVEWLDYLENKVNEASRLSDNINVGVCVSLQTDSSGNVTTDTNINSQFRIMKGIWGKTGGKADFPMYARVGNGSKTFKSYSVSSIYSGTGKSVYGNSKYSQETTDYNFKDNIDPDGDVISPTMDYYGDNENIRNTIEAKQVIYKDIDNALFEVSFGENDILSNYSVENKLYTLIQVNIYKQNFKNLLKYSTFECKRWEEQGGEYGKYLVDEDNDNRWIKLLNISDKTRNIFESVSKLFEVPEEVELPQGISRNSVFKNVNQDLPTYMGHWSPASEKENENDDNSKMVIKKPDTSNFTFTENKIYYWIADTAAKIQLWNEDTQRNEEFEVSDSAILTAILTASGRIDDIENAEPGRDINEAKVIWDIKNFKYCNNFGSADDDEVNTRYNRLNIDEPEEDYIYSEIGHTYERLYGEDIFLQFILQSLGIFGNEETLKQCTYSLDERYQTMVENNESITFESYSDFLKDTTPFELCLIKHIDTLEYTDGDFRNLVFKECLKLIKDMGYVTLKDEDETPIDDANNDNIDYQNKVMAELLDDVENIDFAASNNEIPKILVLNNALKNYIIIENKANPLKTVKICDLKETLRVAEFSLRAMDYVKPEDDENAPDNYADTDEAIRIFGIIDEDYLLKFPSLNSKVNILNLRKFIDENVFLFTTNDIMMIPKGADFLAGKFIKEDIICFFKTNEQFYIFKLNKNDVFASTIEIERFTESGVYNDEWLRLKDEKYNSISISKKINSTFKLPRKYLNDNYEFDLIINPQFIGTGFEYKEDGTIDKSTPVKIEISRGAIYYDKENEEFFTWTYEVEDAINVVEKDRHEIVHKHGANGNELKLRKFAIEFAENSYFKNILYSSGQYYIKEKIDSQNNKIEEAFVSAENELNLNIDKISSNDKILEVKEVKLRPLNSGTNEASFLSNYSEFTGRISGVDFENNKIIFEPQNITEKSELLTQVEQLLPSSLIDGQVSPDELPENNIIDFNDESTPDKPVITQSRFERLPVITNVENEYTLSSDFNKGEFKYFKNNLIFVGSVDRKNPNIITYPRETKLQECYGAALNLIKNNDIIQKAYLLDPVTDGNTLTEKTFVVNENDILDTSAEVYRSSDGKFFAILLNNGNLSIYTQNNINESRISFNSPIVATNLGQAIGNNCHLMKVASVGESYIAEVSIGSTSESSLYEIRLGPNNTYTYKKLFGSEFVVPNLNSDEYLRVNLESVEDAGDNDGVPYPQDYEIIKAEDIKGTLQEEPQNIDSSELAGMGIASNINLTRYIDYFGANNPTNAYEPMDNGRFIYVENNSGNGLLDSIVIKGTKIFIYSKLYNYNVATGAEEGMTERPYWHSFDLSTFISDTRNLFDGVPGYDTAEKQIQFTKECATTAQQYLDSIGETNSLRYNIITKILEFLNVEGLAGMTSISLSNEVDDANGPGIGLYKDTVNNYYSFYTQDEALPTMSLKEALIILCDLIGAGDCVRRIIDSPIKDAYIRGTKLFIVEENDTISYIELENLYRYSDYSNWENWHKLNLREFVYYSLDTNGYSYRIQNSNGQVETINIPMRTQNSIFNIVEVEDSDDGLFVMGNIISGDELNNGAIPDILSLTETEPENKLNELNNYCLQGSSIRPVVLKFENDNFIAIYGPDEAANTYISNTIIFNNERYFFGCYNDGTLSTYGVLTLENNTLKSKVLDDNDIIRDLYNTDDYIDENGNICWITKGPNPKYLQTENTSDILSNISNNRIVKVDNNGTIKLDKAIIPIGYGIVRILFSVSTQEDITDNKVCVPTDGSFDSLYYTDEKEFDVIKTLEYSETDSFHNADRVYSFNQQKYNGRLVDDGEDAEENNPYYFPYLPPSPDNPYYEETELLNDSGNPIKYCSSAGLYDIAGEIARTPKYYSIESLNKDITQRIELTEIDATTSSINSIKYSSSPFADIDADNLGIFKNYLISGDLEIGSFIERNFTVRPDTTYDIEGAIENSITNNEPLFIVDDNEFILKKLPEEESDDSAPLYLYNSTRGYFLLDSDIYYRAELKIPYLFNTKNGQNLIDTDFNNVSETPTAGIYLPKNGYGSFRGNLDEWIYNKPWDIDAVAFDNKYLYNNKGEPIYLVGKNGQKIISKNGEQKFKVSEVNNNKPKITKELLGDEKYRTITVIHGNDKLSITVEKLEETAPHIYCPFIEPAGAQNTNFFNGFVFKVMKDTKNICESDKLKVFFNNGEESEVEFTYENSILTLNFNEEQDSSHLFNLRFEYEDCEPLEINNCDFDETLTQPDIDKINELLIKDIVYIKNGSDESEEIYVPIYSNPYFCDYEYFGSEHPINIDVENKILSRPSNKQDITLNTKITEKVENETIDLLNARYKLNINYIDDIYIFTNDNNKCYIIGDTHFDGEPFNHIESLNDSDFNGAVLNYFSDTTSDEQFDILKCNKLTHNGLEFKDLPYDDNDEVVIKGIQSEIIMKQPHYSNYAELFNNLGSEISTGKIIYKADYKDTELYVSATGNNVFKLNNLIGCNQPNIENNLNDGKVHYIKMKLLTATTILPSNDIIKDGESFVKIDAKDLIEWPIDRVYFNSRGIKLPPVKIGNKFYRNENVDDYNKISYKNNNGYKIFECDENGNYTTYIEDKGELVSKLCTSVNYLFNPYTPKNELNMNSFKNRFYKEGEEQNPFWQIIRIKKEYNELTGEMEEKAKILEYKKYSDSVNLFEAEHPYISIYKTSTYEEKEDLVFLNKNVDFVNKKKGEIKFTSRFNDRDYYAETESILKFGIEVQNTLKGKIEKNLDRILFSSFEKCNYEVNNINSNKINNDDSIIEISELGLFNKKGQLMAYATFPPIEYRTDSQHLSFLLYIYDGNY